MCHLLKSIFVNLEDLFTVDWLIVFFRVTQCCAITAVPLLKGHSLSREDTLPEKTQNSGQQVL